METDVGHIQLLLRLAGNGDPAGRIDGRSDAKLEEAISAFQREVMRITPDGRVEPASQTFRAMVDAASPRIHERTRFPSGSHRGAHLTDADYISAAKELGCQPEAIRAVSEVESSGAPFLPSGRPKILFEPHHFSRVTHHLYDKPFPQVSTLHPPHRGPGVHAYGTNEDQWTSLTLAALLDRRLAIESASWGRFQILGKSWNKTGAASLDAFLMIMFTSERSQLDGFVAFVKHNHLAGELKNLNWRAFAFGYNGHSYANQHYDVKIAHKFQQLVHAKAIATR
jgi:N-acetylmuramidase/Putative peptidoglycan binding domain